LNQLVTDPVFFGSGVPPGDGHPVIVVPGWLANDNYLQPLRGWLARMGYTPYMSGLKRNTGRVQVLAQQVATRVGHIARTDSRPCTIIGHSLGGVIARAVARLCPELVGQVIAMGSPLGIDARPIGAPIPLTAIYSRSDRIVRYPRALYRHATRNVEVPGSHCGMAFNAAIYRLLGSLLSGRTLPAARMVDGS
jgi:pimeloyl-ACP methyl ester carboxylesterase